MPYELGRALGSSCNRRAHQRAAFSTVTLTGSPRSLPLP